MLAEAGVPGYEMAAWCGIVAPAGLPREVVLQLNIEINREMLSAAVAERYASLSFEPLAASPELLFEQVRREEPMWAAVIKRSGAKVE